MAAVDIRNGILRRLLPSTYKKEITMYRKILTLLTACVLSMFLISCGSADTASPETEALYNYIMENLSYTITDLRVVPEDEGYHITLNAIGIPDMLQKLCEDSLNCITGYSAEHNLSISEINPIITSRCNGVNVAFGWSTDGTLYSTNTFPIAKNVEISDITSKLQNIITAGVYYTPAIEDVLPIADEDIEWELLEMDNRAHNEYAYYYVYINTNKASDSQYSSIFKEITKEDGFKLHSVKFYFSKSADIGSDEPDVIMYEAAPGITPLPKSPKQLKQLLDGGAITQEDYDRKLSQILGL